MNKRVVVMTIIGNGDVLRIYLNSCEFFKALHTGP